VNRQTVDELKRRISLLDYLRSHDWRPARQLTSGRWMGLCPLHSDHKPSFLLDDNKGLFYCYGCGRGGDVIRFVELLYQTTFPEALALLHSGYSVDSVVRAAAEFYRTHLHLCQQATSYLEHRGIHSPEVIEHMRIGYAPGGCLRASLTEKGYPVATAREAGLVDAAGHDSFRYRIVFPLENNLYGRSILPSSACPHRFLPGSKGGLYGWDHVRACSEVILVEGLFDYAALWQAGFHNVTCPLGTHLNTRQFQQLCSNHRTMWLVFDADSNGSGRETGRRLAAQLRGADITVRIVTLPDGHDPNSFFAQGGDADQFHRLLEASRS
jgi:DNA primase